MDTRTNDEINKASERMAKWELLNGLTPNRRKRIEQYEATHGVMTIDEIVRKFNLLEVRE